MSPSWTDIEALTLQVEYADGDEKVRVLSPIPDVIAVSSGIIGSDSGCGVDGRLTIRAHNVVLVYQILQVQESFDRFRCVLLEKRFLEHPCSSCEGSGVLFNYDVWIDCPDCDGAGQADEVEQGNITYSLR